MRTPEGPLGYGFGLFVQDLGPGCGTIVNHNGCPPGGYGALMINRPTAARC